MPTAEKLLLLKQELDRNTSTIGEDSRRLFHGRGHAFAELEHICIDWFNPVVLITLYKNESDEFIEQLKRLILNFQNLSIQSIVLQSRADKIANSQILFGNCENPSAKESGLSFHIDLQHFQNIGFFLDMKNARSWLAANCANKKVLNLFSFTCAFSVVALANGAKEVVNLDMGKGVLERGNSNHQLNNLDLRSVNFIKSDIFRAWKKLHKYGRYDIIIIDPPSFQKGSFDISRDYQKVAKRLSKLLSPDALILACLNAPFKDEAFLDDIFLGDTLPGCSKVERLPQVKEFVDIDANAALKVIVYRYCRPEDEG